MTESLYNPKKPVRLITIFVSHYCEKVRWALERLKIPYQEEPHMPPFHRFATGGVGGKSVPVLVTEDGTFTDSTDILRYLDAIAPPDAKLYPTESELRQQVEELENLFNTQLGTMTRRWAYFYTLNNYKRMRNLWCQNVPLVEQAMFPFVFPITRNIVRQAMNVTPESASSAYEQIKTIFENVGELLADGRSYLVGETLSAADITFAALAAPVLMPPEHTVKPRSLQELPPEMVSEIKAFRKTPAGAYALRLFRNRER
jgi:glutathione S-transferase